MNPIGMAQGWNILGLTERMVIFPLQAFVFFLSFIYTTNNKLIVKMKWYNWMIIEVSGYENKRYPPKIVALFSGYRLFLKFFFFILLIF
ncbi:hypothetical protein SNF32_01445 [Enterococcus mundtii]|nr:hypothetical protein [Enterococcus mundtii]